MARRRGGYPLSLILSMALQSRCKSLTTSYLRHLCFKEKPFPSTYVHSHSVHQQPGAPSTARQFKVTLDGQTLYIEKELAEALGWTKDTPTEGVPLRLSGWSPNYFAITQKGTDAGKCHTHLPFTQLS